ncbi:Acid phosphatase [Acidipropionibacterium acidipropionici ATCC 4875]|jgi:membrane-associated phospholipid phosphatase|uniref:Acid phosphatase n=1 Tax=Acidipropionibacterium acidipropionici (strain ATCC 4875 / DSM 20272 / JCM 6432 / NBRC 12425 / NCIMB 8070 / 4) TaxID=1171373 RepID=K7RWA1_ACIA4|nr:phosphatase PAP2 family protein [Acidipropionibacterium acidipropionici]AFV90701.1 Acid phosphatase [Acidipropionibacterium acidipropionici ATCC 4875]ALN15129.1 acid phosphatase [Acidipropionibacterium acidipropionici]APZ09117.1 acid phosphatase [Acidipropionibacterium acidipropionici]
MTDSADRRESDLAEPEHPEHHHTDTTRRPRRLRTATTAFVAALAAAASILSSAGIAHAAGYPSDDNPPDLLTALGGYNALWTSTGKNDLHGTVRDAKTLQWNDRLTSWINQNATKRQQFRALQNAEYKGDDGSGYDQSISIADGLGTKLGQIYAQGRITNKLPKVDALINSTDGTSGAYVDTGAAKKTFSYPRPFLAPSASSTAVKGDEKACDPSKVNASSLTANRKATSWATRTGKLKITRVPATVDASHDFAASDVKLDAEYGQEGICTGGAFPSGHTTTAYQAGITLATLLPELAPEILARTSEAGNNRIVLGVHYPLDIEGGRIDGEAALTSRWSDATYRSKVLEPARKELVSYLQAQCGGTLADCVAKDTAYTDNPYGGKAIPGGTSQIVTDRSSAVKVYTERLNYGFTPTASTQRAASVPTNAENLLLTAFPTLTASQRRQVLAATETTSGNPLDQSDKGSWQRLNLAAATSAKVQVAADGSVKVLSTGGKAQVLKAGDTTPAPTPTPSHNPSGSTDPSRPGLPSTGE